MIKKKLNKNVLVLFFGFLIFTPFTKPYKHGVEANLNVKADPVAFNVRIESATYFNALWLAGGISGIILLTKGINKYIEESENNPEHKKTKLYKRRGILQIGFGLLITLACATLMGFKSKDFVKHFYTTYTQKS
ncbi:hypothetical protein HRU45_04425 [Candidatus Dependentiae bacterium]|nr:hypothetical protein [Candidatus Dependentiae bacterium]